MCMCPCTCFFFLCCFFVSRLYNVVFWGVGLSHVVDFGSPPVVFLLRLSGCLSLQNSTFVTFKVIYV